jgi:hypothetical protein
MSKIILLLILILGQSLNAQVSSLTEDELKAKIQLDTKVEISESYMKVSAYTTLISIGVTIAAPNFITFGAAVTGIFTTPYHIIRHLVYVSERNRFYLKHNIDRNSKFILEN